MMFKHKQKFLWLAILVIGVVAVGSAFTAANTFAPTAGQTAGYGVQNVSGANVTSMHYTLSSDGTTVTTVTFIADGNLTTGVPQEHGWVGFTVGSTAGPQADCGVGTYNGSTSTTFVCDVTSLNQTVAGIAATDIAVAT
jgi:hypothetical protein